VPMRTCFFLFLARIFFRCHFNTNFVTDGWKDCVSSAYSGNKILRMLKSCWNSPSLISLLTHPRLYLPLPPLHVPLLSQATDTRYRVSHRRLQRLHRRIRPSLCRLLQLRMRPPMAWDGGFSYWRVLLSAISAWMSTMSTIPVDAGEKRPGVV